MTADLEDKLWTRQVTGPGDWLDVARYLVDRLAEYVARTITIDDITPVDGESFSCSIEIRAQPDDPLQVAWLGVVGMEPIQGESWPSATLFPFILGQRVKIGEHAGSTIELVYERRPGGPGQWRCEGWREDEYGEWDNVTTPAW